MNKCPRCLSVLAERGGICQVCGYSLIEDLTRTLKAFGLDETRTKTILEDKPMTPEKWQKIKKLFEGAQETEPAQRRAYLKKMCGDDAELRREVEKLLNSFEEADTSFLEEPAEKEIVSRILENETKAMNVTTGEVSTANFVAGTVVAGRYRIIGLLGKGGMGEVYKAEDLTLNQTVALKFLPDKLAKNEDALKRFIGEVKTARQVSHENVCRVFDIGEVNGNRYLSMEFIEGDDLSQLLNRIGRLPSDKAVEISRQICMGLNAIHKTGILHRDLKPANIIIDSEGKARITDFGIAGFEAELLEKREIVGTPAYMSPEQITGREVTQKSDIYSLGLLIYEIFTGKQAFEGKSLDELIRKHQTTNPTNPSELVQNIDPLVEKIINRCLEKDPKDRPVSAVQVAMALPGGNPLQVALEAGETPSPEMIAAAPKKGTLKPKTALALLAVILVGFSLAAALHQYYKNYHRIPLEKSPEILAERARTVLQDLGYTETPADAKYGLIRDNSFLPFNSFFSKSITTDAERLRAARQIYFYYRQSPNVLVPWADFKVGPENPPMTVAGMTSVELDTRGKLRRFEAVPGRIIEKTADNKEPPDWKKFFDEAGLDMQNFRPADPRWTPPVHTDERAAWSGSLPEFPDVPIQIESASGGGRPVYFEIFYPWDKSKSERPIDLPRSNFGALMLTLLYITIFGGTLLFAWFNLRAGRGDLKGGLKIAGFVVVFYFLSSLVAANHVASTAEVRIMNLIISDSLYFGALAGILYVALEPFARRFWPETLISWNRLLKGDFRDPMIGRDILIGGAVWIGFSLLQTFINLIGSYFSGETRIDGTFFEFPLNGLWGVISALLRNSIGAVIFGLGLLFLLVLPYVIFRNKKISIIFYVVITNLFSLPLLLNEAWGTVIVSIFSILIVVFILTRFGLLAVICGILLERTNDVQIFVFDTSSYMFPGTMLVMAFVFSLAIYGFYISTAGRPFFGNVFLDDGKK